MIIKGKGNLLIYAAGDLFFNSNVLPVNREDPKTIFAHVASTLNKADILFGQLEGSFSERGMPQVATFFSFFRAHPNVISAYKFAGFDVLSYASNHCLDWGPDALLDTIDAVEHSGIRILGVGKNIEEARRPVILERKGTKIAFLAYNSVLPVGYEAELKKPGCAPIRIHTFYAARDWQPGSPLIDVKTIAYREDLEALVEDIKKVRHQADIVLVSMHWGIHFLPSILADYQRDVGHAAIDAGADMIIGHHAHILKGVEVYKGRVIFYSLSNFAFDSPGRPQFDPEYPTYGFPTDSRKSMLVKCVVSDKRIQAVSFLPVMINKQGQPEILKSEDKRSDEVLNYMKWCCQDQNLETKLQFEGDEVIIST